MDKELPKLIVSSTESVDPNVTRENTEYDDPMRATARMDRFDP
jgi:hypothetical protein